MKINQLRPVVCSLIGLLAAPALGTVPGPIPLPDPPEPGDLGEMPPPPVALADATRPPGRLGPGFRHQPRQRGFHPLRADAPRDMIAPGLRRYIDQAVRRAVQEAVSDMGLPPPERGRHPHPSQRPPLAGPRGPRFGTNASPQQGLDGRPPHRRGRHPRRRPIGPDSGLRQWTQPGFDGDMHPPFGGPRGPDRPPHAQGHPGGGPPEGMGGRRGGRKWLQKLFRRLDRDGNGVITRDEFHGRPGLFQRLDQNADGRIDPKEARKAAKRRAATGRRSKNGPPAKARPDRPRHGPPNA